MLPSRTRLESWNPDALAAAAPSVDSGGASIYQAVRDLEDGIDRMPESRAWQGQAHTAATGMFRRASDSASKFKDYTEKISGAMKSGGGSIALTRKALLDEADEIDKGHFHVTDQWVVMIKPARVSAEKSSSLQNQAHQLQVEINQHLAAVGRSDEDTTANILAAAKVRGFTPPDPHNPAFALSGLGAPGDEVPDPSSPIGLQQQEILRNKEMATTIRDVKESMTPDSVEHKTITMMDGSRHEITLTSQEAALNVERATEKSGGLGYDPVASADDRYYDKDGKLISDTYSRPPSESENYQLTEIRYSDGTTLTFTKDANGVCRGGVTTPDGRHGILPEEFFTHPLATAVGGVATGAQSQIEKTLGKSGGQIPWMTKQSLEDAAHGTHFGGLGLGVAMTLYDISNADSKHEMCVAAVEGVSGMAGGEVGSLAGAAFFPEIAPVAAAGGSMVGTWTFGALGHMFGEVACPK
jgi:uncharacterized protein YukE